MYYITWIPKYRKKKSYEELRKYLGEVFKELARQKECEIMEGHLISDHVHIMISIPPKFAVSEIIGFLKGKCAIKIFDRHLELKKRYWGRHFWAKGYCVSTVGLDEEKIRKYVKWQLEKDKRMEQLNLWH
ncbi:MAG: IS200/IS605 family transposase [Desulfobacteraceae bacterium]|nr:IS200/IS605 family transposase [Desulfobacteraceae bacterium]